MLASVIFISLSVPVFLDLIYLAGLLLSDFLGTFACPKFKPTTLMSSFCMLGARLLPLARPVLPWLASLALFLFTVP